MSGGRQDIRTVWERSSGTPHRTPGTCFEGPISETRACRSLPGACAGHSGHLVEVSQGAGSLAGRPASELDLQEGWWFDW